jgi:hypothetical protein
MISYDGNKKTNTPNQSYLRSSSMLALKVSLLILSLFTAVIGNAQPLGSWSDHLPWHKTIAVGRTSEAVYCATPFALFSYYPSDGSMERLTRINALSDIGVSTLTADYVSNTVVVGYENGNLDLLTSTGVVNIPFIKTTTSVAGSKRINRVHLVGNTAWLACGFGIVAVDLSRMEIKETYMIGAGSTSVDVSDVLTANDTIWAATGSGVYMARLSDPFITDPSAWSKMTSLPDSIENGAYNNLLWANGMLHLNHDHSGYNRDVFLQRTATGWQQLPDQIGRDVRFAHATGSTLLLTHNGFMASYNPTGNQINNFYAYLTGSPEPNAAIFDPYDPLIKWIADDRQGLVRLQESFYTEVFYPTGPVSSGGFCLDAADGMVASVPGSGWLPTFVQPSTSWYDGTEWRSLNADNNNVLDTAGYFDLVSVAINPADATEMYVGSLSPEGMFRVKDGVITNRYSMNNSTLQERVDLPGAVYVSSMAFDDDGNLWIVNPFTQNPLHVLTPEGDWHSYYLGSAVAGKLVTDVVIDENGYKWVLIPSAGVVVFSENGTLANTADDAYRLLTTQNGNGGLPDATTESIAVDKDGEIWVGTHAGVGVFFSSSSLFDGASVDAQEILLEQDGNLQVLLETETVTAIAIDDGNRKWLGTANGGVFLMSADGTEQMQTFNAQNSPLFSDVITDIVWEGKTGNVFIATENGVISYKSDATKADAFFNNVYVYPNPVKPEYAGNVAIKGLAANSSVKITDVAGNAVYATQSNGGLAVWDLSRFGQERVTSGVYLVFATDENGKEGEVSKIVVISP